MIRESFAALDRVLNSPIKVSHCPGRRGKKKKKKKSPGRPGSTGVHTDARRRGGTARGGVRGGGGGGGGGGRGRLMSPGIPGRSPISARKPPRP